MIRTWSPRGQRESMLGLGNSLAGRDGGTPDAIARRKSAPSKPSCPAIASARASGVSQTATSRGAATSAKTRPTAA